MEIKLTAYAKLNPVLSVLGVENGLHVLDTLILPTEFGDKVTVSTRQDQQVTCTIQNQAQIENNTAQTMALAVQKKYGTAGVDIVIEKFIPIGAGLGGSSADAAAVMRAMQQLFSLPDPSGEFLKEVGSDVYAQYLSKPVRLRGTGGEAEVLSPFPKLYAYILVGGQSCSTKEVFLRYDSVKGDKRGVSGNVFDAIQRLQMGQPCKLFNDLTVAAAAEMEAYKDGLLYAAGLKMQGMTGSGGAYAGYSFQPIYSLDLGNLRRDAAKYGLQLIQTTTLKG